GLPLHERVVETRRVEVRLLALEAQLDRLLLQVELVGEERRRRRALQQLRLLLAQVPGVLGRGLVGRVRVGNRRLGRVEAYLETVEREHGAAVRRLRGLRRSRRRRRRRGLFDTERRGDRLRRALVGGGHYDRL